MKPAKGRHNRRDSTNIPSFSNYNHLLPGIDTVPPELVQC